MLGLLPILPPFAPLYAETHYRFKYFFSFLSKPEPEVLADAPHRIEPGAVIPILLLAKDAHLAPCELSDVVASIRVGDTQRSIALTTAPIVLRDQWWWTVCEIPSDGMSGWVEISVRFTLRGNGGPQAYVTDNYRTSTHAPLRVYVAHDPIPRLPGLLLGEGHSHSHATSDQVEYGVPPGAVRALGRRMGLDFACVTDHSYDLDDRIDNYLVNDPQLPKWHALLDEIADLNRSAGMILVAGEEVTCRNHEGRNIHCLVLGDGRFHPGSGDSAEHWLRTTSELSLADLLSRVSDDSAIVGAHIREDVPLLQRLLLGRGRWEDEDMSQPGLHAVQFWNGSTDRGFDAGRQAWILELLKGHRLGLGAGNDAHGNFNRFRQLAVPFLLLQDRDHQLFGRVRLGLFPSNPGERGIVDAIRNGCTIATDGPAVAMYSGQTPVMGMNLRAPAVVTIRGRSSVEFGGIARVEIWKGVIGEEQELSIEQHELPSVMDWEETYQTTDQRPHYLRVELHTHPGQRDGHSHRALTNPVWFGM